MPIAGIFGPDDFENPVPGRPVTPARRRVSAAEQARALPTPSLEWSPEVERATAHLYERVKNVISPVEWPFMAPYVKAINELKKVRGAVILAHNYQTPEIFHCVADIGGDSLQLAIEATKVKSDIIVQCGVHFMAETSKILNPHKTVLIPDSRAGCSLASSITAADVRLLRQRFPGVPVVAYVNTSADVKAEIDICCTSSNAVQVVESLNAPTVIFLPDQYLAKYVASKTKVKIIAWKGACEVHERFTGSTAHMINWVRTNRPKRVVMITECSMADNVQAELPDVEMVRPCNLCPDNVQAELPDVEMVRPCNLCPHMKRITLPKILDSLIYLREEVTIDPAIAAKARRSVERMLNLKN